MSTFAQEATATEVERIQSDGKDLCLLIRVARSPQPTRFWTTDDSNLQVGQIVTSSGQDIPRHYHHPIERKLIGTSEVLFVQRGRCELTIYDFDRTPVATRELDAGDIVVLQAGGHGLRILEDALLLEIKQGPYPGTSEKERF